jgi:hypothetical protein
MRKASMSERCYPIHKGIDRDIIATHGGPMQQSTRVIDWQPAKQIHDVGGVLVLLSHDVTMLDWQ